MSVFVSIATMNSCERLRECLTSLELACDGLQWSATVVDNCSHDGTREMLRTTFPNVAVIVNETIRGFGANHNQVLRAVLEQADGADYALVLNDDTYLYPGSVAALARCARADVAIGAWSPLLVTPSGDTQPAGFRDMSQIAGVFSAFTGWPRTRTTVVAPDWLNGCCLMLSIAVLRNVGLFDERFYMFSEDVDLTTRVRKAGYRLGVCDSSQVMHYGHGTISQHALSAPMERQMARSYYLYLAKHRGAYVAELVSRCIRLAHVIRGTGSVLKGVALRDKRRRVSGRARVSLARYSPRRPVFPDRERIA